MRWAIFLRAVNVGGANRCRPALIARQLAKFGVINVGAVGTFVVRENVRQSVLRDAIARKLSFRCEIMIVPAGDVVKLVRSEPFEGQPSGADVVRFVSVLARRLRRPLSVPIRLPSDEERGVEVIAIEGRFVVGLYRREMKAIGYLANLEKLLRVPITTRSWSTIEKVAKTLRQDLQDQTD